MRKHRIAAMILCLAVWTSSCMPAGALYAHAADAGDPVQTTVTAEEEADKAEADAETGKTETAASANGVSAEADEAAEDEIGRAHV